MGAWTPLVSNRSGTSTRRSWIVSIIRAGSSWRAYADSSRALVILEAEDVAEALRLRRSVGERGHPC
jgi:hypothetical protein